MDNVFFNKKIIDKKTEKSTFSKITNTKNINEIKKKESVKKEKDVKPKKVYVKKEKKNIGVIQPPKSECSVGDVVDKIIFESNLEIPTKSPVNITKLNDLQFKKTYVTEIVPSKKQNRNKI